MHELSIAYSLIESAENAARDADARRVTLVRLRLGALAGVVEDALRFGFEVATAETLLDGARLEIELLPVVVHCAQCDLDVEIESIQRFRCPICHAPSGDVVQGHELELTSIEIEV